MNKDDDTRATTRWAPTIVDAGPHRMPVLTRPEPVVALPERPPERQTAPTRVEPLTRPAFERAVDRIELAVDRAVDRILRTVCLCAALFGLAVALTTWFLRR